MRNRLILVVKKTWFNMFWLGIKGEEYRAIKPYWTSRLCNGSMFREYETVIIRCGYGRNAPEITYTFAGVRVGTDYDTCLGGSLMLDEEHDRLPCFIIKVGKELSRKATALTETTAFADALAACKAYAEAYINAKC